MADRLTELEALANAATPGPWEVENLNAGTEAQPFWQVANDAFWNPPADDDAPWLAVELYTGQKADAEFIAASRTAVPELVAEVRRLTAENETLKRERDAQAKTSIERGFSTPHYGSL